MPGIHHEKSPSKADRLKNCPPSFKICKGWIQEDSEDAKHGTILHNAIYDDTIYKTLSGGDKSIIDSIRIEHIIPFQNKEKYPELIHYSELYVEVKNQKGEILTAGTCDDVCISRDIASLKDWKFGSYEVVPAINNMQIKEYVAGLFQKFHQVNTIFAVIVQPCYWDGDFESKQAEFKRDMLPDIISEIEEINKKCDEVDINDFTQYSCKTDNCRYCNKSACKVYNAKMYEAAISYGMTVIENTLPDIDIVNYADEMLCKAKMLEAMIEEKKDVFKKIVIKNGGSANFSVREGKKTRKTDWKSVSRELCEKYIHSVCRLKKWFRNIPVDYLFEKSDKIVEKVVSKYTSETIGDPYVASKMRNTNKRKELKE